jgi:hypothetical protein
LLRKAKGLEGLLGLLQFCIHINEAY